LVLSLKYASSAAPAREDGLFSSIAVGLAYVRGNRAMVGMLMVTVIMNLWGFPFVAMVPVIGRDVLGLSAFPIGVLMSAEGAGAFVGALIIAALVRPAGFNRIYLYGSTLMILAVILFSFSSWFTVSLALLFIVGLGAAGFSAMQTAIMFTLAPPEMRGRVMGVLSVCIGASPLGMLHIGLLALWMSAQNAVLLVAIEGVVALAVTAYYWQEIRR
jgi:MFS family permease